MAKGKYTLHMVYLVGYTIFLTIFSVIGVLDAIHGTYEWWKAILQAIGTAGTALAVYLAYTWYIKEKK